MQRAVHRIAGRLVGGPAARRTMASLSPSASMAAAGTTETRTPRLTRLAVPASVQRLPRLEPGSAAAEAFVQQTAADPSGFLDGLRDQFTLRLPLVGLRIAGRQATRIQAEPAIKGAVLRLPKVKHLLPDDAGDASRRILLLNVAAVDDLDERAREFLAAVKEGDEEIHAQPTQQHLTVDYGHWTADEVLGALLPLGLPEGTPTAFTSTGHIAHLNLRADYLPYRHVIGQVILDKNARMVRTVVNKLDTIDAEFRFFAMERLAGVDDYAVVLSEGGCSFAFDFRTVYWNSRLHAEHARLVARFAPYAVVCDVMAGVGPFAVPAARKGCWVLANDLNPASHAALCANAARNHVAANVRPACLDGRDFIRRSIVDCWNQPFEGRPLGGDAAALRQASNVKSSKERAREEHERRRRQREQAQAKQQEQPNQEQGQGKQQGKQQKEGQDQQQPAPVSRAPPQRLIDDFVMNLPASALEFLDAFRGAYSPIAGPDLDAELSRRAKDGHAWPMVHVHCFTKDLERPHEDICTRASHILGLGDGPRRLVPPPSPPPDRRALLSTLVAAKARGATAESATVEVKQLSPSSSSSPSSTVEGKSSSTFPSSTMEKGTAEKEGRHTGDGGGDTPTPTPELSLHYVRAVAPNKDMYCLSFRLTPSILFDEA